MLFADTLLLPLGGIVIRRVCWFVRLLMCVCAFVNMFWDRISPKQLDIRLSYNGALIGNGIWRIEWLHD